jgi:hypothetical protein
MKKYCLIFAFSTILSSLAVAQSSEKSIRMAFLLSPQVSWLKSDNPDTETGSNRFGYNFGMMLDRFFAPNYAFTTGLTINKNGGSLIYDANTVENPVDYNLTYIEIPFALKLKSSDANRFVFNGQFGLSNQINVEAKDGNGKNISEDITLFNFGYQFGGGVEYGIGGNSALLFGLIYHHGLTDVTKDANNYEDKTTMNRLVFQIGLMF